MHSATRLALATLTAMIVLGFAVMTPAASPSARAAVPEHPRIRIEQVCRTWLQVGAAGTSGGYRIVIANTGIVPIKGVAEGTVFQPDPPNPAAAYIAMTDVSPYEVEIPVGDKVEVSATAHGMRLDRRISFRIDIYGDFLYSAMNSFPEIAWITSPRHVRAC